MSEPLAVVLFDHLGEELLIVRRTLVCKAACHWFFGIVFPVGKRRIIGYVQFCLYIVAGIVFIP